MKVSLSLLIISLMSAVILTGCNNTQQLPIVSSTQSSQVELLASKKNETLYVAHKDPKSKFSQGRTNYVFTKPTITLNIHANNQYQRSNIEDILKKYVEKYVTKNDIKSYEIVYQKDTDLLSVNFYGGLITFYNKTLMPRIKNHLLKKVEISDIFVNYKGESTRLY